MFVYLYNKKENFIWKIVTKSADTQTAKVGDNVDCNKIPQKKKKNLSDIPTKICRLDTVCPIY